MAAVRGADVWAVGAAYEAYVGRWSRLVAREFIPWLGVKANGSWVDVGCGTGALVEEILSSASPARVEGVDSSDGFIAHDQRRIVDPRASFRVGNARALPQGDGSADAVVSGLVLNFIPEPSQAVREMRRVARPGTGVVAAYVWDYGDRMDLMRYFWNAAVDVDPEANSLDEGRRFPMCWSDPLRKIFSDAGLARVEVRAIDIPTPFRDFDDYWVPFLGGQGPAPAYAMSLSEERRAQLRERVRSALPIAPDGSIDLLARAWAVRGVRQQ